MTEVRKLAAVRAIDLPAGVFAGVAPKVLPPGERGRQGRYRALCRESAASTALPAAGCTALKWWWIERRDGTGSPYVDQPTHHRAVRVLDLWQFPVKSAC